MLSGYGNAVLIAAQREELAAIQPESGVADTRQQVELCSKGGDLRQNSLVVVLKRDDLQRIVRERLVDLIPQVHKGLAGIQQRASDG